MLKSAKLNRVLSRSNSASRICCETLESRQLMAISFGVESVINGNAESNVGSATGNDVITPTGWTQNGSVSATIVKYGAPGGFPTSASPGPFTRQANFFAGGPNSNEGDLVQTTDISNQSAVTDAGHLRYGLTAYLGGFSSQGDNAWVFLNFQNSSHSFISQVHIGPVSAADRSNVTGLLLRNQVGTVPVGTRFVQVQIHFENPGTGYNDGYADNVSVLYTNSAATTGNVAGTVFNDTNADGIFGATEPGLGGVKVFADKNNNGVLDAGEINTTSAANGTYTLANLPIGNNIIRELAAPATYRISSTNPQTVNVIGSATQTGKNFGNTQLVLISGNVFNDANSNKIKDTAETNRSGIVVYLDFNNNGQFDSAFELKSTTDSSGNYKFVLPFGTYVVRAVVPAGLVLTTPTSSYSLTLGLGGSATGKNFGIH